MRSGRLRHRVALERAIDAIDEHGDTVPTWERIATVYAAVEPLSGREYFLAAQINAEVSTRITIRASTGFRLTPKDRVRFGARLFDIESVVDRGERGKELELLVVERIPS